MSVPTVGERYHHAPPKWRTAAAVVVAVAAFTSVAVLLLSGLGLVDVARWAAAQQRAFYDMVSRLMSLDGGVTAFIGLMGACLAYGFVHAAVPGHGKFLVAGAGLGTKVSATKLVALSLAGSLAQAATATILVYGSFTLLDITAGWAMNATNQFLIPLSTLAITAIGVVLARRGWIGLTHASHSRASHSHADHAHEGHSHEDHSHQDHGPGCNHRHGPTASEASEVHSLRDAAVLVLSIGLRPCTGAVFVLVAAWRLNLLWVGIAAAVVMALGTGALTSLVAVSATTARGATLLAGGMRRAPILMPLLQLLAGLAIVLASGALFLVGLIPLQ